jgi:glucose dehydrogenase
MRQLLAAVLFAVLFASFPQTRAQSPANAPVYGQYLSRQQYSPLSQIDTTNVNNLRVAWTYDTGERGKAFQATPIVVGNVMYFPTPSSKVVALDVMTGKRIWEYDPGLKYTRVSRGVAYWPGGPHTPPRILFGTADGRLIALDPKTGQLIRGFGDNGQVDVRERALKGFPQSPFWYTSAPAIFHDSVIAAPALQEGPSRGATGGGDPRAFDVLTGKQIWEFHSMPRAGEPGADTWGGPNGTVNRSGPSAWVPIAVDAKRHRVFVTTGNAPGGSPMGENLYADSVVALDARTGKMLWYFQMVHHDIWDFDGIDSAVIEVHRDGRTIPAIAALDKDGFLFILNEETGKPVFGVEERPVPKSDAPGAETSPTQPFPVAPLPLSRDSMTTADLTDVTPQSAKYCSEVWSHSGNDGPFTPRGSKPTVGFPSSIGGPNWESLSFDPKLGYIFVNTSELGAPRGGVGGGRATPAAQRGRRVGGVRFVDPNGYPCQKPPWGLLTAIDANTGKIAWKVPLGNYENIQETGMGAEGLTTALPEGPGKTLVQASCSTCHGIDTVLQARMTKEGWTTVVNDMISRGLRVSDSQKEDIINYLAKFLSKPSGTIASGINRSSQSQAISTTLPQKGTPTGTPNLGGNMPTAGNLVFVGATLDNKFRAFDARTGQQLWSYQLDGVGMAAPMSFIGSDGKQYVAIATGGPGLLASVHNEADNSPDKIVVFALVK